MTTTLVLWDIDGTLVDVQGAGRRAFIRGIERAWGVVDDLADVKFAGATDLGVLASLRARLHLPHGDDGQQTRAFFEHMADELERALAPRPDGTCNGAAPVRDACDVVQRLHTRGVVQGLVTGNARATAFVKLRAAGVDTRVFVAGAYGDEHADRNELARRAMKRMRDGAHVHDGTKRFLVGDTVRDVEAAKAIGAVAIALLRRPDERAAIVAAGADHVVDALCDVEAIVAPT